MLYFFPRSSIKFQGHTVQNITDFDPNWAFPDYRPVVARADQGSVKGIAYFYVGNGKGVAYFLKTHQANSNSL